MKILTNYVSTLVKCVVVIFAMVGVVSCQKSKNDPAPPPTVHINAQGYWTGKSNTSGFVTDDRLGILVKAGGVARVYALDASTDTTLISPLSKTDASWVMNGSTMEVSMSSSGSLFVYTGAINHAATTMAGTWSKNGVVKGTISLTK